MTVLVLLRVAVSEYVVMRNGRTQMDYNLNKYYVADSGLLTEAEKIEMARSLRQLELKGVIQWRDGVWQLAANVKSEVTSRPPVGRSGDKGKGPRPAPVKRKRAKLPGEDLI
jgi:hypothetical protein